MAHDIFGERFYTLRQPAWHALGEVSDTEEGAMAVLAKLRQPIITVEPMKVTLPNGQELELPERTIVRHPTEDDPEYRPFGIVGPEYQLITGADVCTVWDEFVGKPVETAGFLGGGSTFFITSKLPSLDVYGDEVEMYLGAVAPSDGLRSASTEVWPLRVVCANTLGMAQSRATAAYVVRHDSTARARMGEWLADMYLEAERSTEVLKQAFEVLADARVSKTGREKVLRAAYPEPKEPRNNAPADVMVRRTEDWETERARIAKIRGQAGELFDGKGTGMDIPATAGTYWGLYNAVVETEDYRRGWNGGGRETERVAEDTMFGVRHDAKVRALETALALASK